MKPLITTLTLIGVALTLSPIVQPRAEACPKKQVARDGSPSHADTLAWRSDLKQALVDARATGKPAVVFFSTSTCGACDKMVEQTLTDTRVQAALQSFVTVHVDVDAKRQQKVAKALGVGSVPSLVFFSPEGALIDAMTVDQFISADALLPLVKKVVG